MKSLSMFESCSAVRDVKCSSYMDGFWLVGGGYWRSGGKYGMAELRTDYRVAVGLWIRPLFI